VVFDQIEVECDDFPDDTPETIEISRLPLAKVRSFFVGEVLLLVFSGIVNAMAELLAKKRSQFAPPKPSAVLGKLDRAAQIGKHVN
jgi:hypothetical protein